MPLKLFITKIYAKSVTLLFSLIFSIPDFFHRKDKNPFCVPKDFVPTLRFAVCSDIHLDGDENQIQAQRFSEMFSFCYDYSENFPTYNKLDAVIICGDMTDNGKDDEYKLFSKIVKKNLKDNTKLLACMGNHEFLSSKKKGSKDAFDKFRKYVSDETEFHKAIGSYHFIGISFADENEGFGKKARWLRNEIKKAVSEEPDKPVFVFQHPHPALTVFGSIHWGHMAIRRVLRGFSQVVDFSGHSHYCTNDPRSIYHDKFTAVGTGSLTGLVNNINYADGNIGSTLPSASFHIVEVDKAGNIRLQCCDAESRMFFPRAEYYLCASRIKKGYFSLWRNLKNFDTKPSFPEESLVEFEKHQDDIVLIVPHAKGYYDAVSYDVVIKNADKKTIFFTSVSSGYVNAKPEPLKIHIGALPKGECSVSITPVSPYTKYGKALKGKISIN